MTRITPPISQKCDNRISTQRNSNLELFRIVCMLMIVAHHYVVCSGLTSEGGPLSSSVGVFSLNTLFLRLFGMWGKVGINCFLMITGYFMCQSKITIRKWLKLLLEVYFYNVVIYLCFLATGHETVTINSLINVLLPIVKINRSFVDCFLVFYLTIPFWNILIHNMTKKQHQLLLVLLLTCYSVLGSIPIFEIEFNYITWFGVIYLMASYIRLYPSRIFERNELWGWATLSLIILSMASVAYIHWKTFAGHYFVSDSNKILAVLVAVSSFLWFKNLNVPQNKIINTIGASTFGVLLIHSNSAAMRNWLWGEVFNVVGHFSTPLVQFMVFSLVVILIVFFACIILDRLRISIFEEPFFRWYDNHLDNKLNSIIKTE